MTIRRRGRGWREGIRAFFFERLGLDAAMALAAKKRVPMHRSSIFYFLGGMALFLFGIQVVTGILLPLYYKPSPDQAFESVRAIVTEVDFGWLFRSIHSWSANLLIGVLLLHVLTTYIMRAYRRPREFTWMTGVALLLRLPHLRLQRLFAALEPTGVLRHSGRHGHCRKRAPCWASIFCSWPAAATKSPATPWRASTPCTWSFFRWRRLALMGLHLFLVQKHEISVPQAAAKRYGDAKNVPSMPFVPHFLLRDMVGWYLALAHPGGLGGPVSLGTRAKGGSLRLGPGGNQARVVLPLHVPGA